jgi:hypothetical protein
MIKKSISWFICGPSACAYVYKYTHIEALIKSLCLITGDAYEDYTATRIEDEDEYEER